jgi:hypothetical protein
MSFLVPTRSPLQTDFQPPIVNNPNLGIVNNRWRHDLCFEGTWSRDIKLGNFRTRWKWAGSLLQMPSRIPGTWEHRIGYAILRMPAILRYPAGLITILKCAEFSKARGQEKAKHELDFPGVDETDDK